MLDKERINELRRQGLGSRKIAGILKISENTVKSYCRRHPLIPNENVCPQCGFPVKRTPHKKDKKFCSDHCRMAWWNSHKDLVNRKAIYHLTCQHCGQPFDSYGNVNRKFCSRTCYAKARQKDGNCDG